MLTIFAAPRAFHDQFNLIQRNAILSWLKLSPKPEIILFGDDEGATEAAKAFQILHIPEIKKNEFGTPLINDIFEKAQKIAKNEILVYINADIILLSDFLKAVKKINFAKFLIIGRRWDLDVKEEIDFNKIGWEEELQEKVKKEGKLHGPAGIDYMVFPRGLFKEIPTFALGRTAWDNWFLYQAWSMNVPLIDATQAVTTIHQNHTYSHHQKGKKGVWKGPEAKRNLKLADGYSRLLTIRDASLILTPSGFKKPELTIYRIFSFPFRYFEKLPLLKPLLFPGWLMMILWRKLKSL